MFHFYCTKLIMQTFCIYCIKESLITSSGVKITKLYTNSRIMQFMDVTNQKKWNYIQHSGYHPVLRLTQKIFTRISLFTRKCVHRHGIDSVRATVTKIRNPIVYYDDRMLITQENADVIRIITTAPMSKIIRYRIRIIF